MLIAVMLMAAPTVVVTAETASEQAAARANPFQIRSGHQVWHIIGSRTETWTAAPTVIVLATTAA